MVNEVNGKGDGLKAWAWAWGQPSLKATADKAWGMGHRALSIEHGNLGYL